MALSDLTVFSEYTYAAVTEVIDQQVNHFNAASNGTILLRSGQEHQGDFSDVASWQRLTGLVRRRDPYADTPVGSISLEHLQDTMVKVGAGAGPVRIDPSQFEWIMRSPEEAGVVIGQQLAGDTLADLLNTGLMVGASAMSNDAEILLDISGVSGADTFSFGTFNDAQAKFGDRYGAIGAWVMHSKVLFDIFGEAIANSSSLFSFSTINVRQDGFGRTFIVTDSPSLKVPSPGPTYKTLGLVPGAIVVDRNADYTSNIETINGYENIRRSWQAEWSYNAGVKGYAWDKTSGGKAPDDAALADPDNWDRYATSHKDLPGVLVTSL